MYDKRLNMLFLMFLFTFISCTNRPSDTIGQAKEDEYSDEAIGDAKGLYSSYLQNFQDFNEYALVYKINSKTLNTFLGYYPEDAVDLKIGVFKKNDKTKSLLEVHSPDGEFSYYSFKFKEKNFSCSKDSYEDKTICQRTKNEELEVFDPVENYIYGFKINSDTLAIKYSGKSSVNGRECNQFLIEGNLVALLNVSESLLEAFGYGIEVDEGSKGRINICMDAKSGVPISISLARILESELVDIEEQELVGYYMVSFNENLDDSAFDLPVKYTITGSGCDNKEIVIVIEPFSNFEAPVTINTLNYSYTIRTKKNIVESISSPTLNLEAGKFKKINSEIGKSSLRNYELCLEDDCTPINCYNKGSIKCLKLSLDKNSCETVEGCVYIDPLCEEFSCSKLKYQDTCSLYPECRWSQYGGSRGYCHKRTCSDLKSQAECDSSGLNCKWLPRADGYGYCNSKNCYDFKNQPECESSKLKCKWTKQMINATVTVNGSCFPRICLEYKTQSDCESSDLNCRWLPSTMGQGYCTT